MVWAGDRKGDKGKEEMGKLLNNFQRPLIFVLTGHAQPIIAVFVFWSYPCLT